MTSSNDARSRNQVGPAGASAAKVLGIGPDGRKIYTKDRDARGGHRSATNRRSAGLYIGREVHLGVAVAALRNTDTTTTTTFGSEMPLVVLMAKPVPAGTHRGDAVREPILEAHACGFCADVIADPGYTLMRPETLLWPLQQAGISITLRPASYQRGERGRIGGALVLDGQLFSEYVPDDLRDLRLPGRNATSAAEREASKRGFERRATYRYGRHKAPGADGTTRWMCPFHAGRLRSHQLPWTMRSSRKGPLVDLPPGATCCEGTLTVGADQLPLMQPTIVGTSAWWQAWGMRNPVETVNGQLHGDFIEIDKGYARLLDSCRINGLLAHGIAGFNRWQVNQWKRVHRLLAPDDPDALPPEQPKRKHRTDRVARFEDLPTRDHAPPSIT